MDNFFTVPSEDYFIYRESSHGYLMPENLRGFDRLLSAAKNVETPEAMLRYAHEVVNYERRANMAEVHARHVEEVREKILALVPLRGVIDKNSLIEFLFDNCKYYCKVTRGGVYHRPIGLTTTVLNKLVQEGHFRVIVNKYREKVYVRIA